MSGRGSSRTATKPQAGRPKRTDRAEFPIPRLSGNDDLLHPSEAIKGAFGSGFEADCREACSFDREGGSTGGVAGVRVEVRKGAGKLGCPSDDWDNDIWPKIFFEGAEGAMLSEDVVFRCHKLADEWSKIGVELELVVPFLCLTAHTQSAVLALGSCKLRDSDSSTSFSRAAAVPSEIFSR
jgi:hypothetical protein